MILIISGPGGVGKGTIVGELLRRDDRLWLSRSWTTRARRPGEPEDAYVFVDRAEFERHIAEGGFIEWVEFLDYLQGSPVPDVPAGRDVVFEIDVVGARAIRERFPEAISVFVDAPSRAVQRERMEARGDQPERIQRRIDKAEEEAARAVELGSTMVVNDELGAAIAEIRQIIEGARRAG
ncbi:MAG: hypothetical protein KA129_03725 [Microthrixaceae bacterium]|nr:hypothetical protein [Microthrixaceae bacterium]